MTRYEWRRGDEIDRTRNLEILHRAMAETDHQRKWLGLMGFMKEDLARLERKRWWLKWEEEQEKHERNE